VQLVISQVTGRDRRGTAAGARRAAKNAAAVCAVAAAIAVALIGGRAAWAQPASTAADPSQAAEADALFRQGKELMAAGKLAEACAAFERSQAIDPKITTLVNEANCREKNGQLATAERLFTGAATQLQGRTEPDAVALRKVATDRAAALTPKVSRVTLQVAAGQPPGFALSRDGVALSPDELAQPVAWDGGSYTLAAGAPGCAPWTQTITVRAQGDALVIEVPVLAKLAAPSTDGEGAALSQLTVKADPVPRRSRALPIGLGIGALALGGAALGFELWGESLQDDAKDYNEQVKRQPAGAERDRLNQLVTDRNDGANLRRHIAQGMGVVAAGAAGAAIYLYVRDRGQRGATEASALRSPTTPRVSPLVGAGVRGLLVEGRW
jgi:tetratricopeptide (TPR) repeat protein